MGQVEGVAANKLFGGVAEQPDGVGGVEDLAVAVELQHQVARHLGHQAIERLALGQGRLGRLAGGDVAKLGDHFARGAVGTVHDLGTALNPDPVAGGRTQPVGAIGVRIHRRAGEQVGDQALKLGQVVRMNQFIAASADQVLGLVAIAPAGGRDVEDGVGGVQAQDEVGGVVGEHLEIVRPGRQRRFQLAPAGHGGGQR